MDLGPGALRVAGLSVGASFFPAKVQLGLLPSSAAHVGLKLAIFAGPRRGSDALASSSCRRRAAPRCSTVTPPRVLVDRLPSRTVHGVFHACIGISIFECDRSVYGGKKYGVRIRLCAFPVRTDDLS